MDLRHLAKALCPRNIAKHLDFNILDSGLLYRVYAYLFSISGNHEEMKETDKRANNIYF